MKYLWINRLVLTASIALATSGLLSAQTGPAASAKFEQNFLQSFPQHHQEAIDMAQLCVEKAQHPELKQLCQHMISSQTEEKQQMNQWFQSWYGGKGDAPISTEAKMKAQHETMMAKLHMSSGESFDHTMLVDMGEHHRMGIAETQTCILHAGHPELKALCGKMKGEQQKDLTQMNTWVKEWK